STSNLDHKIFDENQDFFCDRRGFNRITRDVTNKYCEVYDFIPTAKFYAFDNFTYTTDQVDLMIKLAKANWLESEKQVKGIIIDTWKKKRYARLNGINFT
ncbi:10744_t:CDS:2, partial [Dentiscutata erythropus]